MKRERHGITMGLVCGSVAGALGSAGMDAFWWLVQRIPGERPEQKPKRGDDMEEEQPSTQIVADRVSEALTGHKVPREDKPAAGVAVHYATGIVWGAAFGMLAARVPRLGLLGGLLYGIAIWLLLDEIGLRLLDIAPEPEKVPPSQHLQALGAHLVYGSATSIATRALLRLLR